MRKGSLLELSKFSCATIRTFEEETNLGVIVAIDSRKLENEILSVLDVSSGVGSGIGQLVDSEMIQVVVGSGKFKVINSGGVDAGIAEVEVGSRVVEVVGSGVVGVVGSEMLRVVVVGSGMVWIVAGSGTVGVVVGSAVVKVVVGSGTARVVAGLVMGFRLLENVVDSMVIWNVENSGIHVGGNVVHFLVDPSGICSSRGEVASE